MIKVYAVMDIWIDYYEDPREPGISRIFDSREKADEYIKERFKELELDYKYYAQNGLYECEMDEGRQVMYVDEHDVY